ncbi:MAG: hypothetical protein UV78_C0021G0015 [Parcubacteria group bacterium GW2011_GWA2_43_17]|nr:MAG: hypothetical protein UV78_C0021G0015 [Parcubacteria group bacterium GW2011_GWA2_43_17]KKT93976.1 MAG: hypothetical protein UW91_C0006G0003 [Parcubacteria group bacterium GW2011_GWF2_45_11]KKT96785.1 MAG: hypothetical protein UW98_C0034G0028 [Parcubacteria group bacterium GW2011_GWC2_45_15]OGY94831.1 MAG: hypothetical protein A2260_02650 [Candidatus Komeilibacteria bacterium RIFOXYA2_FULL_45_9]OGY96082.1 MAG: hypothetical protein A3J95_02510 [Candidatus Komeilibacteria bacterium RIFOXYC2
MPKNNLATSKTAASTQKHLDIAQIRDDIVILRDGTVRAVLLVSSINFALKGEDEQNALIQAYISFLNTLDFPLQIVIQSRRLNIDKYLEKLLVLERQQTNELMRQQIVDYRAYLKELLDLGQIMTKKFYVSVPFMGIQKAKKKFLERLSETFRPAVSVTMSKKNYERYREELDKRVGYIMNGLGSIGLNAAQLDTQSLIELFYNAYNPEIVESQKMQDVSKLRIEEV